MFLRIESGSGIPPSASQDQCGFSFADLVGHPVFVKACLRLQSGWWKHFTTTRTQTVPALTTVLPHSLAAMSIHTGNLAKLE